MRDGVALPESKAQASPRVWDIRNKAVSWLYLSLGTLAKSPLLPVTTGLCNMRVHVLRKHSVILMSEGHFFFPTMRLKGKDDSVLSTSAKHPCPPFARCACQPMAFNPVFTLICI